MILLSDAYARQWVAYEPRGFPTTIVVAGVNYTALSPPIETMKEATKGPFNATRTGLFQMKRTDFVTAFESVEKAQRMSFQISGYTFEIKSVNDDPVEPSVELRASLRQ